MTSKSAPVKDKVALILSVLAFAISIFATITTEHRATDEKRRTIRSQLTEVLGRLTTLQLEGAKIIHEAKDDVIYRQASGIALSQQNGFLLDQAFYLADQIPSLVTTYEFNTIAAASFASGNVLASEKYHLKAIEVAHSDIYKTQATRMGMQYFSLRKGVLSKGENNSTKH